MDKRPLVSILTPSFNQGRFLGDCVASVANQTYRPIEHIVMDGGSTDETIDILRDAPGHVRWVSEPDRGQSHALNKAFAESKGEIIGWLNSDDAYFDAEAVAAAVRVFVKHPEVDLVYGHAALVNADGLILQLIWTPPFHYGLLRWGNFIVQPAAFVRRSAVTGLFADESFDFAMDRELWLRLGKERQAMRLNRIVAIDRHQLARKSLTRLDLAEADGKRLVQMYGVPAHGRQGWQRKAVRIGLRVAGVSLLRSASRPTVFGGRIDSCWRLAQRQVAVKRASMPAASLSTSSVSSEDSPNDCGGGL